MGPFEEPHLNHPENLWLTWFMDGVFNSDIDEAGARSLLHHLIDLSVLEFMGDLSLKLSGIEEGQSGDRAKITLRKNLSRMSQTESGFALIYFIIGLSKGELPPLRLKGSASKVKRKSIFGKKISTEEKKTSNLSNLQIVKKWGNELRPFLDLEQQTIARLRGIHTNQEDAQWLFSYILNKTRQRSPAKKWEQLSRKRHR